MSEVGQILDWIDQRHTEMMDDVIQWSNINSYTFNLLGLKDLSKKITGAFRVLEEQIRFVNLPPFQYIHTDGQIREVDLAPIILIEKRPWARRQALLVIHMDTNYPPQDSLEEAFLIEGKCLNGQGVSDAKGGIAVLLKTLQAFEQSPVAKNIGWKVIINTDDEIGLPCSKDYLKKIARRCDIGFVFEPCLPDGSLVGARKGAGSFTVVARGCPGYVGSGISGGQNAIDALAQCINELHALNGMRQGLTINVGHIEGGSQVSLVPEVALMQFYVRVKDGEERLWAEEKIHSIIEGVAKRKRIRLDLHGGFALSPKPLEGQTLSLYEFIRDCGRDLGLRLQWVDSGHVCAGNVLFEAGLPTVDSLGVQGAKNYGSEEFLYIDSLKERAKLATLSLLHWAGGMSF